MKRHLSKFLPLLLLSSRLAAGEDTYHLDGDTGITLPDGFDAELLYSVPPGQGSWVAMAFDPKGRIIVSDQDDKGVFRVTLPEGEAGIKVESLKGFPYEPIPWGQREVGGALGFLHAFDSLYMSTMKGLYRIRDTDGDDNYDDFKLLAKLNHGYEHSAHSVIVSEDGEALYLVSGNYTRTPKRTGSLQPPVWKEDSLLPPMPDPSGHAVGLRPPGGWVCRITPDGSEWTMIASGFRNPVDIAINREGELFTFDSDLEFDIGAPWYRPTRVNHVTSGSEFGWRSGSAKWPDYFADSNGSVVDIGPGSPTGIGFGHHSDFPGRYQDKLFICDWTFGTIYTVAMEESGSSYKGTKKEFLHGSPLNISAMRFGPDGKMYFLTGGRNTDSKLYRVSHTGEKGEPPPPMVANRSLRELRHSLERFHGDSEAGKKAIDEAWPYLSHEDRNIRYAARIAIENQPLDLWKDRVLKETDARAAIYGCIALCRHGAPALSGDVLDKLSGIPFDSLGHDDRLALLRAYSLCFIRLGNPTAEQAGKVIAALDPSYPAGDDIENAELCRVLSFLDSPTVAGKTIGLMKATKTEAAEYDKELLKRHENGNAVLEMMSNAPNSRNIHYAYSLRRVRSGWTMEDRRYFFGWLKESLEKSGGLSFSGYIRAIREDAIAHLPPDAASALSGLLSDVGSVDLASLPIPQGPPGAWTMESAAKLFESGLSGRDFENGKKMFSAGRCVACHRFGGEGGQSGPDLGSIGKRFSINDILLSIMEPSRTISEQYMATDVTLKGGKSLYGRLIYHNEKEVAVAPNPFDFSQLAKAPADQVEGIALSQLSMMPAGTIAAMNKDELMDLMAYLVSGGNPGHAAFAGK